MIHFSDADWERVLRTYRLWRNNELDRPILPVAFYGRDPGRAKPANDLLTFATAADLSITPEQIVDRIDYELSCREYAGDAYPFFSMDPFGPGVTAAFLGADLVSAEHTVWFRPHEIVPIEDLHFTYRFDNFWLCRLLDIYAAGMKRWRGEVVLSMADLGGILDVLAVFRGTDNLLMDLYDEPEEVKRCVRELQQVWLSCFDAINEVLRGARGYSDWSTILYDKPGYILQSDFSYMIGPDMFDEFVAWELDSTSARLPYAFYHMDGMGELPHLDRLLTIQGLEGIQWVPGEGEPLTRDWSDVYRRIEAAGKKTQGQYDLDYQYDDILAAVQRPGTLIKRQMLYSLSRREEILGRLSAFL